MSAPTRPPPSSVLFARGVIARLKTWHTLSLAIQESWGGPGGPEKRTWLASVIVDAFEEQSLTPDDQYVEEILLQVMSDEFDTEVEDGSAEPVAIDIVKMWEDSRMGVDKLVLRFEETADKLKGEKMEVSVAEEEWEDTEGDDSEIGDEEEANESGDRVPQLIDSSSGKNGPVIDEDGFTLVKGKGRR
ncbi:Pre-rRNA-processing protein TSR2-domain-containing protein [Mucidula mucida]|nr:Pre-rRNA-processing protein TSR2-domain-containing protein [Mucidula mucida]